MAARSRRSRRRSPASAGKPSTTPAARVARRGAMQSAAAFVLADRFEAATVAAVADFAGEALRGLFVKNGPYRAAWSFADLRERAALLGLLGDPQRFAVWLVWDGKPILVGDAVNLIGQGAVFPVMADDLRMIGNAMLAFDDRLRVIVPPWLAPVALAVAERKRGRPSAKAVA